MTYGFVTVEDTVRLMAVSEPELRAWLAAYGIDVVDGLIDEDEMLREVDRSGWPHEKLGRPEGVGLTRHE